MGGVDRGDGYLFLDGPLVKLLLGMPAEEILQDFRFGVHLFLIYHVLSVNPALLQEVVYVDSVLFADHSIEPG